MVTFSLVKKHISVHMARFMGDTWKQFWGKQKLEEGCDVSSHDWKWGATGRKTEEEIWRLIHFDTHIMNLMIM